MGHRFEYRQQEEGHYGGTGNELCAYLTFLIQTQFRLGNVTTRKLTLICCQAMWRHPITAKQIRVLQEEWGVRDPEPSEGDTAGVAVANGWFQVIMV